MSCIIEKKDAEIYPVLYSWKTDDLPFWEQVAERFVTRGAAILELGFGTGRIGITLARLGYNITGIDISTAMMGVAGRELSKEHYEVRNRINLLQADMRGFCLHEKFQLIFAGFNSFLELLSAQDQMATLRTVKEHLDDGGVFALDIFTPDFNLLYDLPQWVKERDGKGLEPGTRVVRDMTRRVDPVRQVITTTFRVQEQCGTMTKVWFTDTQLTYIFPRELQYLLKMCGYDVLHLWGDYSFHEFESLPNPDKQLVIARSC